MNKVMLIINEPETCKDCPCFREWWNYSVVDYYYCGVDDRTVERNKKPIECPLVPIGDGDNGI